MLAGGFSAPVALYNASAYRIPAPDLLNLLKGRRLYHPNAAPELRRRGAVHAGFYVSGLVAYWPAKARLMQGN